MSALLAQVTDSLDVGSESIADSLKLLFFLSAITGMLNVSITATEMFRHSVTHLAGTVTELTYRACAVTPVTEPTRKPRVHSSIWILHDGSHLWFIERVCHVCTATTWAQMWLWAGWHKIHLFSKWFWWLWEFVLEETPWGDKGMSRLRSRWFFYRVRCFCLTRGLLSINFFGFWKKENKTINCNTDIQCWQSITVLLKMSFFL